MEIVTLTSMMIWFSEFAMKKSPYYLQQIKGEKKYNVI